MNYCTREITKDQFERSAAHNHCVAGEDMKDIFSISELCGYGVYLPRTYEDNGKYFVKFSLGSTCD